MGEKASSLQMALLQAAELAGLEEERAVEAAVLLVLRARGWPKPLQQRLVNVVADLVRLLEWAEMDKKVVIAVPEIERRKGERRAGEGLSSNLRPTELLSA